MQNMPAFLPHRGWRAVSIAWLWVEYTWSVALPCELSPDWSYPAIPPIETARDPRLGILVAFVAGWAIFWWRCAIVNTAPRPLVAVAGLGLLPFLLASNLLFPVGTCKAERVLYLPSLGACMATSLALRAACRLRPSLVSYHVAMGCAVAAVCAPLACRCDSFATTWTDGVALWSHALAVQEARGALLVGGATTSAMCELGTRDIATAPLPPPCCPR